LTGKKKRFTIQIYTAAAGSMCVVSPKNLVTAHMTKGHGMKSRVFITRHWILILAVISGAMITFFLHHSLAILWTKTLKFYGLHGNPHELKRMIVSFKDYGPLMFIVMQMLQVVVAPIPGGAIEFMGGYLFGVKAGFLYSTVGLGLGSLLAFLLARIFGKRILDRSVSPQTMKKFDYLIGHGGVIVTFLLFLVPGFPKDAFCYILGVTAMPLGVFLLISTIGRLPGTWILALEGAKAFDHHYKMLLILLAASVFLILIFYLYRERIHTLVKGLRKPKQQTA
jgi:uncharacterized membrane protein YdjX (TVP38/TMEM64 family)